MGKSSKIRAAVRDLADRFLNNRLFRTFSILFNNVPDTIRYSLEQRRIKKEEQESV